MNEKPSSGGQFPAIQKPDQGPSSPQESPQESIGEFHLPPPSAPSSADDATIVVSTKPLPLPQGENSHPSPLLNNDTELLPPASSAVKPTDATVVLPIDQASSPSARASAVRLDSKDSKSSVRVGEMLVEIPANADSLGPYTLLEEIARGGMGIVYKSYRADLNRVYALKVLISGQHASIESIERFRQEVLAAAKLDRHEHIVAIHDTGQIDNQYYFTMDYIDGSSLADVVLEEDVSPRDIAEIIALVAEALQSAHDVGIIHRDIKPQNILLDQQQRPYLTDFGLAKDLEVEAGLTQEGSILGSPPYMPPEQARGAIDEIDKRSDIYSLGATLYYALCKRPPFQEKTILQTLHAVHNKDAPTPRSLVPALHQDLETICLKAMDKDPKARYQSAQDFAQDLQSFLEGRAISAVPLGFVGRSLKTAKKHPEIPLAALVLFMGALTWFVHYLTLKASLDFSTLPLGATVYVDDQAIGQTPLSNHPISPGPHNISVRLDGYLKIVLENQEFRRGKNERYQMPMVSSKGVLVVLSNPSKAQLRIGRKTASGAVDWLHKAEAPLFKDLEAGDDYIVEARAPGYRPQTSNSFSLKSGRKQRTLTFNLVESRGELLIEGRPQDTPVLIQRVPELSEFNLALGGGALIGLLAPIPEAKVPLPVTRPLRLPGGKYLATAELPGHRKQRRAFELDAEQRLRLRLDLSSRYAWLSDLGAVFAQRPPVFDVNNDGVLDIIVGRKGQGLVVCSGDNGRVLDATEAFRLDSQEARPFGVLKLPEGLNSKALIVTIQGGLIAAFDAHDGRCAWTTAHGAQKLFARVYEKWIFTASEDGKVTVLDGQIGRVLFSIQIPDFTRIRTPPVVLPTEQTSKSEGIPNFCVLGYMPSKHRHQIRMIDTRVGGPTWSHRLYPGTSSAQLLPNSQTLVSAAGAIVSLIDTRDGRRLSSVSFTPQLKHGPLLADFTGDGHMDGIFTDKTGRVFLVEKLNKAPKVPLSKRFLYDNESALSCDMVAADFDGDGVTDVATASWQRPIRVFSPSRGRMLVEIQPFSALSNIMSQVGEAATTRRGFVVSLRSGDFDQDGVSDLAFLSEDGRCGLLACGQGQVQWKRPLSSQLAGVQQNGESLLVGTTEGHFVKLGLSDGRLLFDKDILVRDPDIRWYFSDLDFDGQTDALIAGELTGLIAISGRTGKQLWHLKEELPLNSRPNFSNDPENPELFVYSVRNDKSKRRILALIINARNGHIKDEIEVQAEPIAPVMAWTEAGKSFVLTATDTADAKIQCVTIYRRKDLKIRFQKRVQNLQSVIMSPPTKTKFSREFLLVGRRQVSLISDTGEQLWTQTIWPEANEVLVCKALVGALRGPKSVDFALTDSKGLIYALDGRDGKILWTQRGPVIRCFEWLTGTAAQPLLFCASVGAGKVIRNGRNGQIVYRFGASALGPGQPSSTARLIQLPKGRGLATSVTDYDGPRLVLLNLPRQKRP